MLTKIQKNILGMLACNCRFTNTEIAKAIGVSSETVQYHIENIIEKKQYGKFSLVCNALKLGYSYYHFFIKLRDPSKQELEALKRIGDIFYLARLFGKYDLQVIAFVKKDPYEIANKIRTALTDNIQTMSMIKHAHEYKWTNILPDLTIPKMNLARSKNIARKITKINFAANDSVQETLDRKDGVILTTLVKNPRASYAEISKTAGISSENARYRLKNMINQGIIQSFTTSMNFGKFGYFSSVMLIKTLGISDAAFKEFCEQKEYIWYSSKLEGEYGLVIYMIDKNPLEFSEHADDIRAFLGDSALETDFLYYRSEEKNLQLPQEIIESS